MAYRRFAGGLAFTPTARTSLRQQHLRPVQPLARPRRGRLARPADGLHGPDRAAIAVSPVDGTIVLCADRDGDEFHQLYLLDPAGGWPEQITDEPEVQHYVGAGAWSPDGTKLAYAANARTPTDMEVWVRDVESGETRRVFGEGMSPSRGWSPDGTKLLAIDFRNNSDTSITSSTSRRARARELTPHEDDGDLLPGPWARGRLGLLPRHRRGQRVPRARVLRPRREPLRVGRDARRGRRGRRDLRRRPRARLARQRGRLGRPAAARPRDGRGPARARAPAGARPHLTGFRAAVALSPDGRRRRHLSRRAARPRSGSSRRRREGAPRHREPDRRPAGGRPRRRRARLVPDLRRPRDPGLALPAGGEGGCRSCSRSTAGRRRRSGRSTSRSTSTSSAAASPCWRRTSAARRATARSTSGSSSATGAAATCRTGSTPSSGCSEQDWVDADRIGVYGGSYGGFAVLSCVTRLPDYWAAAVDIFGPSNLVTFCEGRAADVAAVDEALRRRPGRGWTS